MRVAVWAAGLVLVVLLAGAGGTPAAGAAPLRAAVCGDDQTSCATVEIVSCAGSCDTGTLGSGEIVTSPSGIDCVFSKDALSGTCKFQFAWSSSDPSLPISFTATGAGNVVCYGAPEYAGCHATPGKESTNLVPGEVQLFQRSFDLQRFALSVSRSGIGSGKVTSSPSGIDCGSTCAKDFDYGSKVTLTAAADAGAVFTAWTGACAGQGATCDLTIDDVTSTNAVFGLPSSAPPPPPPPPPPPGAPPPPPQPPPPSGDKTVDADVLAAKAGKSRLGARVVRVEILLRERLSAGLQLRRNGKQLAAASFTGIQTGDRVLTLLVPPKVTKGTATLKIALTDAAGNTKGARRTVAIPAP